MAGVSRAMISRRVNDGVWERLYAGVYRLAGAPRTWKQSLLAACRAMGEGAVVSHSPAAGLLELVGFLPRGIELSIPRHNRRVRGIKAHRPMSLARADVTVVDAIPVTTPARTLIDLATCVDEERLEEALDDALRRRLVSLRRLQWRMDELGARTVLKRLVEERAHGVTESKLETRVLRALLRAGLPRPALQHSIGRYRVDLAYVGAKLAIECDGYKYHSDRRAFDSDRIRRNALTNQGWTVLHATWTTIADVVEAVGARI